MALDRPEQVRGLVLLSGYFYPTMRLDAALVAPVALPAIGDVMRYTVSPIAGRLTLTHTVHKLFAPRPVPPKFLDHQSRGMMLRPKQIRANAEDARFMVSGAKRLRERYPELKLPMRIFAGTDDLVVDCDAHSGRLHRELAHSTLDLVPGAGHMVHYAVPGWIALAAGALAESVGSAVPAVDVAAEDKHAPLIVRTDEAVVRLDPPSSPDLDSAQASSRRAACSVSGRPAR
jgi:pimeloyl-ACP methyl ester carboxylesterase